MRRISGICAPIFTMALMATLSAVAQDTRTVTEPVAPPACTKLQAEKTGDAEKLAEIFEKTTDTARIQAALDACKPGMAVELAPGDKNLHVIVIDDGSLDRTAEVAREA